FSDERAKLVELNGRMADPFDDGVERFRNFAGDSPLPEREPHGEVAVFEIFECRQDLDGINLADSSRVLWRDTPHAGYCCLARHAFVSADRAIPFIQRSQSSRVQDARIAT